MLLQCSALLLEALFLTTVHIFTFDDTFASKFKSVLTPVRLAEIPKYTDVKEGLPNEMFSSDHLCIMCEFVIQDNEV